MRKLLIEVDMNGLPPHTDEQLKKWIESEINFVYEHDQYGELHGISLIGRVKVIGVTN